MSLLAALDCQSFPHGQSGTLVFDEADVEGGILLEDRFSGDRQQLGKGSQRFQVKFSGLRLGDDELGGFGRASF